MKEDPDFPFNHPAPPPDQQAMEAAWQAALGEFRRRSAAGRAPHGARILRFWPVAALAAAIAILCVVLVRRPAPPTPSAATDRETPPDLVELYTQGRKLFGARLQAVTVSKDRVVWHLSEEASAAPASDQLLTITLKCNDSRIYVAAAPGEPVEIDCGGRSREIEFLPDESDQVIAVGDGIYWDSNTRDSPMTQAQLQLLIDR